MAQGTLKIHTENILPIIKKWLYSDKEIFVRELVANACDALSKVKLLLGPETGELRIDLSLDKQARTLTFTDTGIGMTAHEVETYIAQIAFSGAEEFLSKYKPEGGEKDQIIGHFGLGFYSAYMVAERVDIDTLSHQNQAESVFWSCDGSTTYSIDKGTRKDRGTTITLHLDKDSDEFLEEERLKEILQRYCIYLPFPIYLNGAHINGLQPLWTKSANECTEQEYVAFYHQLYPLDPDPLFWVHVNVDYPFHLKGILYFPQIHPRFDWAKSEIKLFCNRVFVSDNCKDLLPDYLMALRGVLDSPDIPLNVSRSSLQMDRTVRQLSSHIAKKVADRLTVLYQTERENFYKVWKDIEVVVKLGALQDEKFYERCKEFVLWKNTSGEWTTVEEYRARNGDKAFYTSEGKQDSHLLELYKQQKLEVLSTGGPVDNALINFLEGKLSPLKFQRVDGAIDSALLDAEREKTLLDTDGQTEAVKIANFFRSKLHQEALQIEAKSLASDALPAILLLDENFRRMRDYMAFSGQTLPSSLSNKRTLVLNTNNKLIAGIYKLADESLAAELVEHIYELALLGQKELEPAKLAPFTARTHNILERLIN